MPYYTVISVIRSSYPVNGLNPADLLCETVTFLPLVIIPLLVHVSDYLLSSLTRCFFFGFTSSPLSSYSATVPSPLLSMSMPIHLSTSTSEAAMLHQSISDL
ncbi:hypothetical protein FPOAC2_00455 [Fusarium poae]|jgi:hypothetical protein